MFKQFCHAVIEAQYTTLIIRTGVTGPDAPLPNFPPPGHLVLGPDAPLQDQMLPFIIQVCEAFLKRTFKLLKRSTD